MRLIAKGWLYNIALTGLRVFGSFFDDLICNLNQFHESDIIVKTLEEIKRKGKLKSADVVIRYLRMKYKLILSRSALEKRIKGPV